MYLSLKLNMITKLHTCRITLKCYTQSREHRSRLRYEHLRANPHYLRLNHHRELSQMQTQQRLQRRRLQRRRLLRRRLLRSRRQQRRRHQIQNHQRRRQQRLNQSKVNNPTRARRGSMGNEFRLYCLWLCH